MRRFGLVAALAACFALVAAPASAAHLPVGDQLNLAEPCLTSVSIDPQPSDTPFHVMHGFGFNPPDPDYRQIGQYRLDLALDGEQLKGKLVVKVNLDGDWWMSRRWLFNFPDGLSEGTHTFEATWTGPDEVLFECTVEVEFTG